MNALVVFVESLDPWSLVAAAALVLWLLTEVQARMAERELARCHRRYVDDLRDRRRRRQQ